MRRYFRNALGVGMTLAYLTSCSPKSVTEGSGDQKPKQTQVPLRLGDRGHYQRNENKERVIVFVHGIYGSAMTTWNCSQGKGNWPELMSADDTFKHSDIYVVDYPSPQTGNIMS